jgi:predicted nucleic acid-binding protein
MTAVLDASPLCYLLLIGEVDLLPQLFSRVVVPRTVILELRHDDAPATVRNWAANLPIWISVEETPNTSSEGMEKLQAGERAAIVLAELIQADIIVIDEKAARLIARRRGLSVTGVLGVIGAAATRGLLDLTQAIDRLRRTSFRCSPALFKAILEQYGKPPAGTE